LKVALWTALASFAVVAAICAWFWWSAPSYAGQASCGVASYYGAESAGVMANGQRFNPNALTAAMWSVPFGTRYRVTFGGRSVVVTITDRGPDKRLGRIIDLSRAAARSIGLPGVGRVCLTNP
jgi:rare lipoprotein A